MKRRAKDVGGMCANAMIFYRRANIQVCRLSALAPPGSMMRQSLAPNYGLANFEVPVLEQSMTVMFFIMAAEESRVCEVVVLSRCLHTCQLSRAERNVHQARPKKFIILIFVFALRLYDKVDGLHANSKEQAETYILYRHVSEGCSTHSHQPGVDLLPNSWKPVSARKA